MLRHLDLFSGIGGFSLACRQLEGIRTTRFVEINADAQAILRSHFPGVPIHFDIRDYIPNCEEFDLITCGFPCTGTSNAGTRTGLDHPASALWKEGLRVIATAQPKFVVVEQPAGVLERGLRTILGGFRMAGYQSEVEIISAARLGAGHRRKRLFIISYPDEWADFYKDAPCWSDQVRDLVSEQRLNSQWLTVRDFSDRPGNGISVRLADGLAEGIIEESNYTEPNRTPGRIRARYLAGRTVTPGQAAVALRRVLYLNSLSHQATT